jgi:hypothetical protein
MRAERKNERAAGLLFAVASSQHNRGLAIAIAIGGEEPQGLASPIVLPCLRHASEHTPLAQAADRKLEAQLRALLVQRVERGLFHGRRGGSLSSWRLSSRHL